MIVLSALSSVNLVIPFSEDTPEELISFLQPNVLVKGGDYKEDQIAGVAVVRELGGEVIIIPLEKGNSTSLILEKLENSQ